jgi:hypothetical protein
VILDFAFIKSPFFPYFLGHSEFSVYKFSYFHYFLSDFENKTPSPLPSPNHSVEARGQNSEAVTPTNNHQQWSLWVETTVPKHRQHS